MIKKNKFIKMFQYIFLFFNINLNICSSLENNINSNISNFSFNGLNYKIMFLSTITSSFFTYLFIYHFLIKILKEDNNKIIKNNKELNILCKKFVNNSEDALLKLKEYKNLKEKLDKLKEELLICNNNKDKLIKACNLFKEDNDNLNKEVNNLNNEKLKLELQIQNLTEKLKNKKLYIPYLIPNLIQNLNSKIQQIPNDNDLDEAVNNDEFIPTNFNNQQSKYLSKDDSGLKIIQQNNIINNFQFNNINEQVQKNAQFFNQQKNNLEQNKTKNKFSFLQPSNPSLNFNNNLGLLFSKFTKQI